MAASVKEGSESTFNNGAERVDVAEVVQEKCDPLNIVGVAKEGGVKEESAAVEVQRLFRGHRARRNIADAATMAHKFGWWNVVEGAVLDYNSTQFYAFNKPQNAAQRWVRLKKKAAKVGKGLSRNEKARKLALQHWLEAIDPRHRYGHNLHFYYKEWGNSRSLQPFFYWLDIGEGKDLDLEVCKRKTLQKDLIRYLSPSERKAYEVLIEDGKLIQKLTGEPVNTSKGEKWIFVMSTSGRLYVGKKEKGKLQHSSFLAGGATTAAGRLLVNDGTIEVLEAHSGHYHPTKDNFLQLISILTSKGADLTTAQVRFVSDDMLAPCSTSNSQKEKVVEELEIMTQEDVPAQSDQELAQNNETGGVRELLSLNLEDEQNASSVDEVKLMESTCPEHSGKTVDVEYEVLERGDSFDEGGMWESLKGLRLETINPTQQTSQVEMYGDSEDAASKTPSEWKGTTVSSHHNLLSPAIKAFTHLEVLSQQNGHNTKSAESFEFTPRVVDGLLRWAALNKRIVTTS